MRGQRLFEISDPIRADEMWVLNDRPSLRFVRDALQMRRAPTIDLVLSRMPEPETVSPPAVSSIATSNDSDGSEPGEHLTTYMHVQKPSHLYLPTAPSTACRVVPERRNGRPGLELAV